MVPQLQVRGWSLLAFGNRILKAFPARWLLVTTKAYDTRSAVARMNTILLAHKGLRSCPQPWETLMGDACNPCCRDPPSTP